MSAKIKTAFILGTWFGSGKAPVASGTFGSLAALPFAWAMMYFVGWPLLLAATVVVYFIGVWAAKIIMDETKTEDPGMIVIDEVAGMWTTLLVTPLDPFSYMFAFAFFRIFDITKPFPVGWADTKLKNATGVMLDDVFAGVYGLICMRTLLLLMPEGGWTALATQAP